MSATEKIWDDSRVVEDAPEWCKGITWVQVAGVAQGGCESRAYPPAVQHREALETMNRYGDQVFAYLEELESPAFEQARDAPSWSEMACHFLSAAVNNWCWCKAEEYQVPEEGE